jgi:GNAT superfamily N-acetyltransferase
MVPEVRPDVRLDSAFDGPQSLTDGTRVVLAPLGPGDRADLIEGFANLSRESRYLRFFSAMPHLPGPIVDGLLATDEYRHYAVCARRIDAHGKLRPPIVGVARYFRDETEPVVAEPAVAVIDDLQRCGLGRLLLRALARHARAHGIERYRAHALASNERIMHMLAASNGSVVERDGPVVVYDIDIRPRPRSQPRRRRLRDILRALLPPSHR